MARRSAVIDDIAARVGVTAPRPVPVIEPPAAQVETIESVPPAGEGEGKAEESSQSESVSAPRPRTADTILLEVPISEEILTAQFGVHLDVRLNVEQSNVLRRVALQLDKQQATLLSGRRCLTATDAIRFLLEQLAGAT